MPLSRIVLRTDARPEIGYGHFFRSLALAQAFTTAGSTCVLASLVPNYMRTAVSDWELIEDLPGGEADWRHDGFTRAVAAADLLVTDLYAIDEAWQRHSPIPVLAVSDPPLASQRCDLLVLPTVFPGQAPAGALSAPDHALIRRAFVDRRRAPKTGSRLLVSCGGGLDNGLTRKILETLAANEATANVSGTVALGAVPAVEAAAVERAVDALPNMTLMQQVQDMAALVDEHDWAIGTPAGSALERACLGLAQILIPIAENQQSLAAGFRRRRAALVLAADCSPTQLQSSLVSFCVDAELRTEIATAGFGLVDGRGAARVVAAAVEKFGTACG